MSRRKSKKQRTEQFRVRKNNKPRRCPSVVLRR